MSTFATIVASQSDLQVRFALYVQGIPDVYLDGETPRGPDDVAWTAPTDTKGLSYTWRPYLLDVSQGIDAIGAEISRRAGASAPGALTLRLADGPSSYLLGLFARDNAAGHLAYVDGNVDYDTGVGSTITVDTASGWAASGYAYCGRETMKYSSKTGTTLVCTNASGGYRDVFSLGQSDSKTVINTNKPLGTREIADYPRVWHGRYVRLLAFLVDQDGRALDTSLGGTYSREIYRGVLVGDPLPTDAWKSWRLQTKSIDEILQSEIGKNELVGTLLRVPGDAKANASGSADMSGNVFDPGYFAYALTEDTAYLVLDVTEWPTSGDWVANTNSTTATYKIAVGQSGQVFTRPGLVGSMNLNLKGTGLPCKDGAGLGDFDLSIWFTIELNRWNVWIYPQAAGMTKHYHVVFHWSAPGSIGPLLGFEGEGVSEGGNLTDAALWSPDLGLAVYIGPDSPSIPFFMGDSGGMVTDTPPATGYVRIGDEVLYYGSITDSSQIQGLKVLEGCQRGKFGTPKTTIKAKLSEDWTSDQELRKVQFGAGFEDASLVDVILELAISTGSGEHGAWDLLPAGIAVPLAPVHFDTAAMQAFADGLITWERQISLFISKPTRLAELVAKLLAPLGAYITARPNDAGLFLVTIDRTLPALESESIASVQTSELDAIDPAAFVTGNDQLVNEIEIGYSWDAAKESVTEGATITLGDSNSIADYGTRNRIEWQLVGRNFDAGSALKHCSTWAGRAFQRHGRPWDALELHMSRAGWVLKPGDVVSITVPRAPSPTGVSGLTSRLAVVISVSHRYHAPEGTPGTTAVVLLERYARHSTYAPTAVVASYDAGLKQLTLQANAYTLAGTSKVDVDFFAVGDVLRVYSPGDYTATVDQRTVTVKSGNVLTLNAALTNCSGAAGTVVMAAAYASVQASQKKRVFIADNSTPPVLPASDTTAYRYI